jgi:hypothetical protein
MKPMNATITPKSKRNRLKIRKDVRYHLATLLLLERFDQALQMADTALDRRNILRDDIHFVREIVAAAERRSPSWERNVGGRAATPANGNAIRDRLARLLLIEQFDQALKEAKIAFEQHNISPADIHFIRNIVKDAKGHAPSWDQNSGGDSGIPTMQFLNQTKSSSGLGTGQQFAQKGRIETVPLPNGQ